MYLLYLYSNLYRTFILNIINKILALAFSQVAVCCFDVCRMEPSRALETLRSLLTLDMVYRTASLDLYNEITLFTEAIYPNSYTTTIVSGNFPESSDIHRNAESIRTFSSGYVDTVMKMCSWHLNTVAHDHRDREKLEALNDGACMLTVFTKPSIDLAAGRRACDAHVNHVRKSDARYKYRKRISLLTLDLIQKHGKTIDKIYKYSKISIIKFFKNMKTRYNIILGDIIRNNNKITAMHDRLKFRLYKNIFQNKFILTDSIILHIFLIKKICNKIPNDIVLKWIIPCFADAEIIHYVTGFATDIPRLKHTRY